LVPGLFFEAWHINFQGGDTNDLYNGSKRSGMPVHVGQGVFLQWRDLPRDRREMQRLPSRDGVFSRLVLLRMPGSGSEMEEWQLQFGDPCFHHRIRDKEIEPAQSF
jgi:hypothetical protein